MEMKSQWKLEREYDGWTLRGLETGLYVGVEDRSTSNGAKVVAVKDKYICISSGTRRATSTSGSSSQMSRRTSIYQIMEKDQTLRFGAIGRGSTSCGSLMNVSASNAVTQSDYQTVYDISGPGIYQHLILPEVKKVVIAGITNDIEVGTAVSRLFVEEGYVVAILDNHGDNLMQLQKEHRSMQGFELSTFKLQSNTAQAMTEAWESVRKRFNGSLYEIRASIWNPRHFEPKKFMDVVPEEVDVPAAISFARQAILALKGNTSLQRGSRKYGTLIFTGKSGKLEANAVTCPISSLQCISRFLSQALCREFEDEKIHVAHVILNDPVSVDYEELRCRAESVAKSYLYLIGQDRSAWTWELDLRSAQSRKTHALGNPFDCLRGQMD